MAGNPPYINTPHIWPDESDEYQRASLAAYPSFLPMADRVRLEKIRQARMLFEGRHERFFLTEGRTQFFFRRVLNQRGLPRTLYLTCNLLRLISLKAADLIFGESPLLTSDSIDHADAIKTLADRCDLHQVLYQAAVDASAEGEAFLEAVLFDGEVYIQQIPADEIFPVGDPLPDGQHAAYIRRQLENVGTQERAIWLVMETTSQPGLISRQLWQLDDQGQKKTRLALDQWPAFQTSGVVPTDAQPTGCDWNTVVWVPNLKLKNRAVSDYDGGVVSLQDSLNAKHSQLALVLLKHAQPKLIVPDSFDANGESARANDEVFTARQGEVEPKYLTWDAQLQAAKDDRVFTLNQILVQSETSPVLLGLKEGAAPDAYRKVRLEAFNSLTKAARRAVCWTQGIRTILTVAAQLEQTIPGNRYDIGQIGVTLRDGIPIDAVDRATELSTLRSAGLMSVQRGLSELIGDPAAAQAEEQQLAQERESGMPSVLIGETNEQTSDHGTGAAA